MKRILIGLAATFAASSAMAADVIYNEPAPMPMDVVSGMSWAGFYAGIQAGYGFGSTGQLQLDPFTPGLAPFFPDAGFFGDFDDGFIGGVHIGYDWQAGNVVYGAILDVNYADIGDIQGANATTGATYFVARELDYLATLRGRIGYVFADRYLAYATGGVAYGDVDFTYGQPGSGATFTTSGGQDSDFGYTVGGGLETLLSDNLSIGIEYLYTNLGSNDFGASLTGGPGDVFGAPGSAGTRLSGSSDDFDFHTITAKISYRF